MCSNLGSGSGGGSAKATNARFIENMNEAQINSEITKAKRDIAKAEKDIRNNSITNSEKAKSLQEAFPLGYGKSTTQQIKEKAKINERDAKKAAAAVQAMDKKEIAETRLKNLEKAKKQISGTGKTVKEVKKEVAQKAVKSTSQTLKWTTKTKGGWSNGGYTPKTIKSGSFEIRGTSGLFSVYQNGQKIATTTKLSEAKTIVERRYKKA